MTTSLQRRFRAALRVAIAPLITDLPIILLARLVTTRLPRRAVSGIGVLFGVILAINGLRGLVA